VLLTLTADQNAAYCLVWCVQQWNQTIERVFPAQTGGYDANRPVGGLGGTTSNHMSGTAVDVNYTAHPQHVHTFSDAMTAQIHAIIAQTEGVVRWGGDWTTASLDEQHIELNTTDQALIKRVADKLHTLAGTPTTPVYGPGGIPGSTTTGDPTRTTLKKLPPQPLTPIGGKSPVSGKGQLSQVRLGGRQFVTDIQSVVTSATMSYASTEVGALSLTVQDDRRGSLLHSGYVALGVPVSFGDQRMDVRTIDTGDGQSGPELRIEARSRTIYRLRTGPQTGEGSWGVVDTGQWIKDRASEVGARTLVQPNLYKLIITRLDTETTWDVMQKLAGLHQAWCFEYEQTIVFGQPTWLASRKQVKGWRIDWTSIDDYTAGLATFPTYHASVDATDPTQVETLTLSLNSSDAYQFRPGDLIDLTGSLGEGVGWWIVTQVSLDLGGAAKVAASVTAQRVINPAATGKVDAPGTAQQTTGPAVPGAGQA
jgi:hypothetical protein